MEDNTTPNNKDVQMLRLLERANQIANTTQLDSMLSQMLSLSMEITHATAGILYLLGEESLLVARAVQGIPAMKVSETMVNEENYLACQCLQTGRAIGKELWGPEAAGLVDLNMLRGLTLRNTLVLPIPQQIYPTGVLQLFNLDLDTREWVQFLCNRMATEIQKLVLLQVNEERTRRLQSMVGFLGRIDPSLDPQQNLETIIEDASQLLNAEVSSLFLTEKGTNDLVLRISSREGQKTSGLLRVPRGKGIIGEVVQTGETRLVKDVTRDQRHYKDLDRQTDFNTRSLIAVPVYNRPIHLAYGHSTSRERIIGGIEAINKMGGEFDAVDLSLLQILANEVSTVLQISSLFDEANGLFMDSIRTIIAAINAKDNYTQEHVLDVSDLSVMIAKDLGLSEKMIRSIRIGSWLHDVGKVGIPDSILNKPGSLTAEEYEIMKQHPVIGEMMLRNQHALTIELEAISQHHERLDGSGYPRGLRGDQIGIIGRIVAVADAFHAMTSKRSYREAMSDDEAFQWLLARAGTKFDPAVIDALLRVHQKQSLIGLFEHRPTESVWQDVSWMAEE